MYKSWENLHFGAFGSPGATHISEFEYLDIWVTDPWVSIQINFWESLLSRTEVPHTCKIVNYFNCRFIFAKGGQNCWEGVPQRGQGCGARGWGKGDGQGGGVRGQGEWNLYFN